jgi:hypothetical protein
MDSLAVQNSVMKIQDVRSTPLIVQLKPPDCVSIANLQTLELRLHTEQMEVEQ